MYEIKLQNPATKDVLQLDLAHLIGLFGELK